MNPSKPAVPGNLELCEETIGSLASLKPEILRTCETARVITLDCSAILRAYDTLQAVLVDSMSVDEAVNDHSHWLNTLVYECLRDSPVVPILVIDRSPITRLASDLRMRACEGVKGQPIIGNYNLSRADKGVGELLRRSIVESSVGHKVNPYNTHNTAVSRMFFGRLEELHQLQTQEGHFFILGARRIGKTSLATQYVESVNSENIKIPLGEFVIQKKAIILDVSSLGQNASTTIWSHILREFGLDPSRWILYSRRSLGKKHPPSEDPAFAVQFLIEKTNGRLSIVLDEMDGWVKRESTSNWQAIDRLRSFTDGGKAKLILVGYELLRAALQNDRFPLYDRGTRMTLGPIDYNTLKQLVTKPLADFGASIDSEELLTKIRKKTGGMPHIVQDICNILLNDCLKEKTNTIDTRSVRNAFNKSQKYNDFIRGMINCGFPLAEAIAGIVALNCKEGPVQISKIISSLNEFGYVYDGDDFELAMNYLELRHVIVAADDFRNSWKIFNEAQRDYMSNVITARSIDNWLSALVKKHKSDSWRSIYENLL